MSRYVRLLQKIAAMPPLRLRPGALGDGYSLWGRHPDGDVLLYCGNLGGGWYDRFTPVEPGERPDFVVAIAGVRYRLVRGVDEIPPGFVFSGAMDKFKTGLPHTLPNGERCRFGAPRVRRAG